MSAKSLYHLMAYNLLEKEMKKIGTIHDLDIKKK
jgi:hypothetical protein